MSDIIWGNGAEVISPTLFVLNVTHRKDGNKDTYADTEKIEITDADVPGLPQNRSEWTKDILSSCTKEAFLKIEVDRRDSSGVVMGKVSHSGVGGY